MKYSQMKKAPNGQTGSNASINLTSKGKNQSVSTVQKHEVSCKSVEKLLNEYKNSAFCEPQTDLERAIRQMNGGRDQILYALYAKQHDEQHENPADLFDEMLFGAERPHEVADVNIDDLHLDNITKELRSLPLGPKTAIVTRRRYRHRRTSKMATNAKLEEGVAEEAAASKNSKSNIIKESSAIQLCKSAPKNIPSVATKATAVQNVTSQSAELKSSAKSGQKCQQQIDANKENNCLTN